VYGPPPKGSAPRKSNLGVCGICRRPMKVADGDGGKSNSSCTIHSNRVVNLPFLPQNWRRSLVWALAAPLRSFLDERPPHYAAHQAHRSPSILQRTIL